jgi:hypothetical protein
VLYTRYTEKEGDCIGKSKLIATRFSMEIHSKIDNHELPNSELIRNAVIQYLNGGKQDNSAENIDTSEDMYNEVYNTLYNTEVTPLKQEVKHLNDNMSRMEQNVCDLKDDKLFLQDQLRAQTVIAAAKTPLLTRIKMKLLRQNSE